MTMFKAATDDPDAIRSCRTMTKGCFFLSMFFMLVAQVIVSSVGTGTVNMWDSNQGNTTIQGFDMDWNKTPFSLDVTNCIRMTTGDPGPTPAAPSVGDGTRANSGSAPLSKCSDTSDCKQGECIEDGEIAVSTPASFSASNKCDDPTVNLPDVNTCIFKSAIETDPCKMLTAQLACFPKECCSETGLTGATIKLMETAAALLPGCTLGECGANGFAFPDGRISPSASNKCDNPNNVSPGATKCVFKSMSETDPCKKLDQIACYPQECCVEGGMTGSVIKLMETTAASLPGCTIRKCGAEGNTLATSPAPTALAAKCADPNASPDATKCIFKSLSETDPCKKLDQLACYPKECCAETGAVGMAINLLETTAATLPGCAIRKCGAEGNTFSTPEGKSSAASQNGMCINDIEQSETTKITGTTKLTDCFPWSFVERSRPFIGAFWAFFLMYMGVQQFAFGNCQWRAKHPGFFLFVLLATAYVVYDINMVYNKMFYDAYMKLVDCSDVDDIHLAFARKKYLKLIGKVCYAYNEKIPSDQLKTVIGVNSHSDINARLFIYLFKTFNAGIIMAWLSIVLSFIGILFSPYLQVGDCGCPICSGAVHEPAKIKKKESGGGDSGGGGGGESISVNSRGSGARRIVATNAADIDAEFELAVVPRSNSFGDGV